MNPTEPEIGPRGRGGDEESLIDFLLGRCDESQGRRVRLRLGDDAAFRRLHDDLSRTLAALGKLPAYEPPSDLVRNTLARIRSAERTEALLARQEMARVYRPTFSLRELGAMAAAVVLMAAVFVPMVHQARSRALERQCAAQAGQIGTALLTYAAANDGALPVADASRLRWLPASGQPAVSNSSGLFRLIRNGYISPVVFQCPSVGGGSFAVQAGMTDFPADRFVSYSYQHALGSSAISLRDPAMASVSGNMAILADSTPVFAGGRFRPERVNAPAGDNHGGKGQNVLYLDMHVDWARNPNVGVAGNNIFLAEGKYVYQGDETPAAQTDTFLLPSFTEPLSPNP